MQINDYCLVDRLEVSRKQRDHLEAKAVRAKPEKSRWLLTFHLYAKTKKKKKKRELRQQLQIRRFQLKMQGSGSFQMGLCDNPGPVFQKLPCGQCTVVQSVHLQCKPCKGRHLWGMEAPDTPTKPPGWESRSSEAKS